MRLDGGRKIELHLPDGTTVDVTPQIVDVKIDANGVKFTAKLAEIGMLVSRASANMRAMSFGFTSPQAAIMWCDEHLGFDGIANLTAAYEGREVLVVAPRYEIARLDHRRYVDAVEKLGGTMVDVMIDSGSIRFPSGGRITWVSERMHLRGFIPHRIDAHLFEGRLTPDVYDELQMMLAKAPGSELIA